MVRAQKEPLRPFEEAEDQALERVSRASSEWVDTVRRARTIQTVAPGAPLGSGGTGGRCRERDDGGEAGRPLQPPGLKAWRFAAGRGRRVTYDTEARIVAVAQQEPQRHEDQTATWSLSTLQRWLRRGGLPRVGMHGAAGCARVRH